VDGRRAERVHRVAGDWGIVFGALLTGLDLTPVIDRASPKFG